MLNLEQLKIEYNNELILQNDKLTFNPGNVYVIEGKSGSGKTSLLYVLGLISEKMECRYIFNNHEIKTKKEKELMRKNHISYIFQDKNIFDGLTIKENLLIYSKLVNKELTDLQINDILKQVGLKLDMNKNINIISGGEKQRVAIACALIKDSKIIIADEPTSSLDEENSKNIMQLLKKIAHTLNKIVIIASHDKICINNGDIIYRIVNKKIETTVFNDHSNLMLNNQSKLSKENRSFYKYWLKCKFNQYFSSLKKVLILNSLLILISSLMLIVNDSIIKSYNKKIAQLLPNEIQISKVLDEDIEYIQNFEGVLEIRPQFMISNITIDTINGIKLISYYPDEKIPVLIEKENTKKEVYVSLNLERLFNQKIEFIYEGKTYQYNVDGVFNVDKNNVFNEKSNIIYLPESFFESLNLKTDSYILKVKDSRTIKAVAEKINNINPNIRVISDYSNVERLLTVQNNFRKYIKISVVLMFLTSIITIGISQFLEIESRIYEICLLHANGLNKMGLLKIECYRLLIIFLISTILINLISIIIFILLNKVTLLSMPILNFEFILYSSIMGLLILFIPTLLCLNIISNISMEKVLR